MKSVLSAKKLSIIQKDNDFVDQDKIFYFLDSKKKGEYGIFKDDLKEKRYSFKFQNKDLGCFLTYVETRKVERG
jgi:nitrous oxide reductase accessory protein NosL